MTPTHFDAAPARARLETAARSRGLPLTHLAIELRIPRRTLYRVLAGERIRWTTADHIAIALGHHPAELWPHWFSAGPATAKESAA